MPGPLTLPKTGGSNLPPSNGAVALPFADVETQIATSSQEMRDVVWPVIEEQLGGGTLIPQEGLHSHLCSAFDSDAGIDHFQHNAADGFMRGLATRVQHFPYCYRSFTIRLSTVRGGVTEYEKLMCRSRRGALTSDVTIQGYTNQDEGVLVGALWIKTAALCRYLLQLNQRGEEPERIQGSDGNSFYVVWLEDLERAGYGVKGYNVCELERPGHPDYTDVGFYG